MAYNYNIFPIIPIPIPIILECSFELRAPCMPDSERFCPSVTPYRFSTLHIKIPSSPLFASGECVRHNAVLHVHLVTGSAHKISKMASEVTDRVGNLQYARRSVAH